MEKKVLEMYVSPAQQVVELEVKTTLLSGSDPYEETNGGMSGEGGGRDD